MDDAEGAPVRDGDIRRRRRRRRRRRNFRRLATESTLGLAVLGVLAVGLVGFASPSEASVHPPTTLDRKLLESDAIFFATISTIAQPKDDLEVVELTFADVRTVASRWPHVPGTIRVRAHLRQSEGAAPYVRPPDVYEDLVQGDRYLFLLRGGAWRHLPFMAFGKAVFPVRDGEVKCHGGEVYGLAPRGFHCDRRHRMVGPPLGEAELAAELRDAVQQARTRRPSLAAQRDAAAEPFELERSRP